ncbi:MAG: twitch domain-containing radical SAM protein [Bdellovibrionaceae bacterium]|nr:twitch domain-containing radical SAM protein [Pseudobdellovibrionaceae bacterium]
MAKNPSICAYPFMQLSTVPAGFFRPCCYYSDMLTHQNGTNFSVTSDRIATVWNSDDLRNIRKKMLNGEKLPKCSQCYSEELASETSLRLRSLKDWSDHPVVHAAFVEAEKNEGHVSSNPLYLELKPGNLCNLKCRMCNQFDSSSVAAEIKELSKKYEGLIAKDDPRLFDKSALEVDFSVDQMPNWSQIPEFWDDIAKLLPSVEQLSFAGGEPTLLPEVQRLLEICVKEGYAKNICVYLSSNFTRLNNDFIELSKHFRLFEFIASIDGTSAVQEYIRHPSRWPTVAENFRRVKEHVRPHQTKLLVNLTLQMYNIMSFTDVLYWIEDLAKEKPAFFQHPYAINVLYFPRYLSIDILPQSLRPLAASRIDAYVKQSKLIKTMPGLGDRFELIQQQLRQPLPGDYRERIQDFWNYTRMLDSQRKQSLANVEPALYAAVASEVNRLEIPDFPVLP